MQLIDRGRLKGTARFENANATDVQPVPATPPLFEQQRRISYDACINEYALANAFTNALTKISHPEQGQRNFLALIFP